MSPPATRASGTVADLVVDALRLAGIDTLFCLPGVQNDEFFDALVDARDIRPIVTRHEQGAAYLALGASQITGAPSACCVVPGPGALNAGAALTSAYWAGGRVLAVVGAIPHALKGRGIGVLHELPDQTAVLRQVAKHSGYVSGGEDAVEVVQAAIDALARGLARPVSLEVPVDCWPQPADGLLTPPSPVAGPVDGDEIERAAATIGAAQRPVIVVGSGAYDAGVQVEALAERLGAPVFTRRQGHGVVDARHRLSVPLPVGRNFWAEADVAVGIGTRMEFPILHWGADGLDIVQINHDADELDRHDLDTVGVLGDAAAALDELLVALDDHNRQRPDRRHEIATRKAEYLAEVTTTLSPQCEMLAAVREVLPDDGVIVEDVTQLTFAAHVAFEFRQPRTFLTSGPAGTLGAGVAQAIGAQIAAPDRRVLAIAGDGGFLFTAAELATAVQYEVPVTVLLHDNQGYGNVRRIQRERYGPDRTIASDLQNPDFVQLGQSFGVETTRVGGAEDLRPALDQALTHDGPSMVVIETGEVPSPWPYIVMPPARQGSG